MTDVFSSRKRSAVMAAIRSSGNKDTELRLVALLRSAKVTGWRRGSRLPGKPDLIFANQRLAVFVDGCFWHGCPWHGRQPGSNSAYWMAKLARNRARDRQVQRRLNHLGWSVIRIWEHSLERKSAASAVARIERALKRAARRTDG